MQNSLKTILMVAGVILIAFGLYTAFVPETLVDAGPLQVKGETGFTTKSLTAIGIGVVALIAAVMSKKK